MCMKNFNAENMFKMCRKNFNAENMFFDKLTAF